MNYSFLTEAVWHPPLFAESVQVVLPAEIELQAMWYAGAFGRKFQLVDGREVEIVQFGEWNRAAGPDFSNVAVKIDDELHAGGLELDPSAASWELHGHATNPEFNSVVLHVFFEGGARVSFTRTSEHKEVPQLCIPNSLLAEALNRPQREVAIAQPGRCFAPLKHVPALCIGRLLDEAAQHRAQRKANRFLRTADVHGKDMALYLATAETLGYRGNSLAMQLLAQRAPLGVLKSEELVAEAVLFGTAGFLSPTLHEKAPDETRDYLRALWDDWWKSRARFEVAANRTIPWKLHGQRPANHPHRRVGALSTLVAHWPKYRKLAFAQPFASKPVVDFLRSLEHPFWSVHHTLTSQESAQRISVFGKSQATELLANHLIPLALREKRMTYRDYYKLRNSQSNDAVRRCALRLFGSEQKAALWLKRTCHHQALLQIYHDFCLEDVSDCENCPFPEQLAQWR